MTGNTGKKASFGNLLLLSVLGALVIWYLWIGIMAAAVPVRSQLPPMPEPHFGDRILVFAPHEDDETLGAAIYMRRAIAAGARVYVCLMTAGEGEELGAAFATRTPLPSPSTFVRLGHIRQRESIAALARIGLPKSHIIFLNYPCLGLTQLWSASNWSYDQLWTSRFTRTDHSPFDGGLTANAPFCGASVLRDVETVLQEVRPTHVVTLHPSDVHPDHWPTYGFAKLALEDLRARTKASWLRDCQVYTYLVHYPRWPVPWGYYPDLPLMPPAQIINLPINHWLSLPESNDDVAIKNRMILTYRSQMARYDMLLRAFARRTEIFAKLDDISLTRLDLASQAVFMEPTGESRYLSEHPSVDIAEVGLWSDGESLQIHVKTAAPQTPRGMLQVVLHIVNPAPDTPKAIQIRYRTGQPATVTSVADDRGPTPIPALANCAITDENTTIITLPYGDIGNGRMLMVDVMAGQTRYDHSMTRTVLLPPRGYETNVYNKEQSTPTVNE
ncbi:MAG: PIG-L deacetylase family protein [Bacteroidota bacterium]